VYSEVGARSSGRLLCLPWLLLLSSLRFTSDFIVCVLLVCSQVVRERNIRVPEWYLNNFVTHHGAGWAFLCHLSAEIVCCWLASGGTDYVYNRQYFYNVSLSRQSGWLSSPTIHSILPGSCS
jgi:hypothetical protein